MFRGPARIGAPFMVTGTGPWWLYEWLTYGHSALIVVLLIYKDNKLSIYLCG